VPGRACEGRQRESGGGGRRGLFLMLVMMTNAPTGLRSMWATHSLGVALLGHSLGHSLWASHSLGAALLTWATHSDGTMAHNASTASWARARPRAGVLAFPSHAVGEILAAEQQDNSRAMPVGKDWVGSAMARKRGEETSMARKRVSSSGATGGCRPSQTRANSDKGREEPASLSYPEAPRFDHPRPGCDSD
jgi:hypothetical protein